MTVVGRLPRTRFSTEEVWVHPNGKYAYLGTGGGGDRMYVIDISNPAAPKEADFIPTSDPPPVGTILNVSLVHPHSPARLQRECIVR